MEKRFDSSFEYEEFLRFHEFLFLKEVDEGVEKSSAVGTVGGSVDDHVGEAPLLEAAEKRKCVRPNVGRLQRRNDPIVGSNQS